MFCGDQTLSQQISPVQKRDHNRNQLLGWCQTMCVCPKWIYILQIKGSLFVLDCAPPTEWCTLSVVLCGTLCDDFPVGTLYCTKKSHRVFKESQCVKLCIKDTAASLKSQCVDKISEFTFYPIPLRKKITNCAFLIAPQATFFGLPNHTLLIK